jgi:hypothetical protein
VSAANYYEAFDAAFLEHLLSEHAMDDAMDAYIDCVISSDQFNETVAWGRDALDRYSYVGDALFYPEVWVL